MLSIITAILNTLVVVVCIFLICLILIQRGKGGGLVGAFGGTGSSSAFGTKAGDVFTRVTVIVAAVWIVMSMFLVVLYNNGSRSAWGDESAVSREVPTKSSTTKTGGVPAPIAPSSSPASIPAPAGGPSGSPLSVPAIPDAPKK